jgi:manganese/zinc/iron transport system substrate-binding protein
MNKKINNLVGIALLLTLFLTGCRQSEVSDKTETLNIVATTTMLADLTKVIGGEHVKVDGLMGPGIDPHLYQASAGDVALMQKANIVVYNGLHLEGKMGEIFESFTDKGKTIISIEEGLNPDKLLAWEADPSIYDPHIWFDVSLWKDAATIVEDKLSKADPAHQEDYSFNLEKYLKELDDLDLNIKDSVLEIPEDQRVLITAHDAFNYFGKAYGFMVKGLQGISTDSEAATSDVSSLAKFITERKIKAIFIESSVPPKTIEALQDAVTARGFDVEIGGQLYSDSLGGKDSGSETYILTVRSNIDTIVEALK